MPSLTYAGQPLLLPDPDGQLARWLARVLPQGDARKWTWPSVPFGDPTALPRWRGEVEQLGLRLGMPRINWPPPPRPRLNSLWWPTGATRWACGWFLADQTTLDTIEVNLDADGAADLVITESDEKTISARMWMLPPQPLTESFLQTGLEQLYILTLVDRRYLWQFVYGQLADDSETGDLTWGGIFDSLETPLGVEIVRRYPNTDQDEEQGGEPEIEEAYATPDRVEWRRDGLNLAVALDAAAWCVGKRVVYGWDDRIYLVSAARSGQIELANVQAWPEGRSAEIGLQVTLDEKAAQQMAGGEAPYGRVAPAEVAVWFPCKYAEAQDPTLWEDHYEKRFSAETLEYAGYTAIGTVRILWDTAAADFAGDPVPSTPANADALTALAEQIARDYYEHLDPQYDRNYAGLKLWFPSGKTDYVWWHWGTPYLSEETGDYAAFTRVASLPPSVGVSHLLHDPDPEEAPEVAAPATRIVSLPQNVGMSHLLHEAVASPPGCPSSLTTWNREPTAPGSNDLGDHLEVLSGSWHIEAIEISGGWEGWAECEYGDGLVVHKSDYGFRAIWATFETTANLGVHGNIGDERTILGTWRIVLDYQTDGDHVFAQWTRTSVSEGTLSVGRRVGGVDSVSDSVKFDTYMEYQTTTVVYVIYTKSGLLAYCSHDSSAVVWDNGITPGTKAGRVGLMGIGATTPSDPRRFDNFFVYENYAFADVTGRGLEAICVELRCACDTVDVSTAKYPTHGDLLLTAVGASGVCANLDMQELGSIPRLRGMTWSGPVTLGELTMTVTISCGETPGSWGMSVAGSSCWNRGALDPTNISDPGTCSPLSLLFTGFLGEIASPGACGCDTPGLGGQYDVLVTEAP